MSYWKDTNKNTKTLENFGLATNNATPSKDSIEFYELELGIVLDIVLDEKHPIFVSGDNFHSKIEPESWPEDLNNNPSLKTDFDYTWIGRALIRPLVSERLTNKDQLIWAYPLESNISEYPLINETVILISQDDKLYYTKKVNYHNWPNNNIDFGIENSTSGKANNVLFADNLFIGKTKSKTNYKGSVGFNGYAGQYFVTNNKIRTVRRFEGDLLLESRHGQTIHFTSYDKNRNNDSGLYKDYQNGGNPMIIIRNRQRSLLSKDQSLSLINSPNPALIRGTIQEKNVGGFLDENINHDGSSIYITSGQTISDWVTTCYKRMFHDNKDEEVLKFRGNSPFQYPVLNGDQIVINTDRLILSSRYGETFHYSKKRYGIVTDNEYILDAHQQIVLTTNTKTVINSPAIYLGEYDQTGEPALLGQTTVNWLYELCNWLLEHTHWYLHSHENAGKESPSQTQIPSQIASLIVLRDKLKDLMSRRVFLTGGGFAPGQNGGTIPNGTEPVKISLANGSGVPGGWFGSNNRSS